MCIEQIRIECELTQSTFGGGLNANCKWIGLTYVIILSPYPLARELAREPRREPIPCLMCVKTEQRAQQRLPARRLSENVSISISLKVIKRYYMDGDLWSRAGPYAISRRCCNYKIITANSH